MEAYGEFLEKDNIWRILAFVRSVSHSGAPAPVTGDRAHGEQLYRDKGRCASCHLINGQGGRFGPDLSRVGRQRSYEFLRTAVIDPGLDIGSAYRTLTVVTQDGKKITGIERGLDNFTAQLMDADGNFHSFDKAQVRSAERENRSLMPDNYGKLFSAAELDDLLAYLSSLRGEAK
jgi:putative heme-binding domain-containing protein